LGYICSCPPPSPPALNSTPSYFEWSPPPTIYTSIRRSFSRLVNSPSNSSLSKHYAAGLRTKNQTQTINADDEAFNDRFWFLRVFVRVTNLSLYGSHVFRRGTAEDARIHADVLEKGCLKAVLEYIATYLSRTNVLQKL